MKDLRRVLVILLALTADGRTADVTVRIDVTVHQCSELI